MIIDKNTTLAEFCYQIETFEVKQIVIDDLFDRLKSYPLPDMFNASFDKLKFRQLIDLQTKVKTFDDLIFVPLDVVHGLKRDDIVTLSAFDCLRFALYVKDELERITNLFKKIEYKPTDDERMAGINLTSGGFFGTIDWYARRMGIADHDTVANLNWVVIYKCLEIDFNKNQFEKRYRTRLEHKNKR